MKTLVTKICVCGTGFNVTQHMVSRGRGRFCSKSCQYANATRPSGLTYVKHKENPTSFKKNDPRCVGNKYCEGREPWNKGVKGIHLSPETEFKYVNGNGYRHLLYRAVLPQFCQACLDEPGLRRLHVHHIDRDRSNNKVTNLITLCRPCHLAEHGKVERQYVEGRKAV